MKLLFVYTVEASLRTAVKGQLRYLVGHGHDVHVAVSPDPKARSWVEAEGATFHELPMSRSANDTAGDIRALRSLICLIRSERPDLVVCGSPKAGMLSSLAGRLARVPVLYFLHGLRLEGATGVGRLALFLLEWLTCRLATRVVAVGWGLRAAAVKARVISPSRIDVVGEGSANGVDLARFRQSGSPTGAGPTFGFVGRITRDKGVEDLVRAWRTVKRRLPSACLVVLGEADTNSERDRQLMRDLEAGGAHMRGFVAEPAPVIKDFDILVLPSRREGLPTVVLEAAAAGVPAIMYSCTGSDAVVDGVTGKVVAVGDWKELGRTMADIGGSPELIRSLGREAYERVTSLFAQDDVWNSYEQYFGRIARGELAQVMT